MMVNRMSQKELCSQRTQNRLFTGYLFTVLCAGPVNNLMVLGA